MRPAAALVEGNRSNIRIAFPTEGERMQGTHVHFRKWPKKRNRNAAARCEDADAATVVVAKSTIR